MNEREHKVVTMSDNEAYPAVCGIKCVLCGKCSLGWFCRPEPLSRGCKDKEPKPCES